jgi:REP element-mobilizing transposase RayT
MPTALFVHLTWTTFRRMPMIGATEARFLGRFLPAEARRHRVAIIALGLVRDHVHLLLRLPGQFDLPRLVQGLKGTSARLANADLQISRGGLRWASGYHVHSVSPRNLSAAVDYVRRQANRHPDRAIPEYSGPEGAKALPAVARLGAHATRPEGRSERLSRRIAQRRAPASAGVFRA